MALPVVPPIALVSIPCVSVHCRSGWSRLGHSNRHARKRSKSQYSHPTWLLVRVTSAGYSTPPDLQRRSRSSIAPQLQSGARTGALTIALHTCPGAAPAHGRGSSPASRLRARRRRPGVGAARNDRRPCAAGVLPRCPVRDCCGGPTTRVGGPQNGPCEPAAAVSEGSQPLGWRAADRRIEAR
jgi:hypothetical protein